MPTRPTPSSPGNLMRSKPTRAWAEGPTSAALCARASGSAASESRAAAIGASADRVRVGGLERNRTVGCRCIGITAVRAARSPLRSLGQNLFDRRVHGDRVDRLDEMTRKADGHGFSDNLQRASCGRIASQRRDQRGAWRHLGGPFFSETDRIPSWLLTEVGLTRRLAL